MAQVTIMTGPERRRRWGEGDRREILAAAFAPGAIVADVSRRYEVSTSLIYKWRRQMIAAHAVASFVPAVMVDHAIAPERSTGSEPMILVELSGGTRVKIGSDASSSAITATLRALR
jgi:transposase